jgi:hypothetical protein
MIAAGLALALFAIAGTALAGEGGLRGRIAANRAQVLPWHQNYYDVAWGMPVALVVPPTAENQTHWGWGVGNTRVTPIWHQFHRNWPGPGYYDRRGFLPKPPQPSDTDQFGTYYVRGPW